LYKISFIQGTKALKSEKARNESAFGISIPGIQVLSATQFPQS
jgi:hypothetical protein